MADDAARSASVAVVLLLLHDVAQGGSVAENPRPVARCGAAQERKKKAPSAAILDSQYQSDGPRLVRVYFFSLLDWFGQLTRFSGGAVHLPSMALSFGQ